MKKQRGIYIVLLVLLLIMSLMATVACTDPNLNGDGDDDNGKPSVTYEQSVKNGTFYSSYNTTGKNYLKATVDNWTPTKGQTAVSNVRFGAIDMTEENWNAGHGTIAENLTYPGIAPNSPKKTGSTEYQDTMAAVVAYTSNVGSAYYLSSSSTIEKGKKYRLSIDVATFVMKSDGTKMTRAESAPDGKGAYVFVTGGVYNSVEAINTEGEWDTVNIYLEGRDDADVTFNVQLWLGHSANYVNGGETNLRLTSGVMLFDNVILEEVTAEEFKNAEISDNDNNVSYVSENTVHKFSAKYFDDADFEYNTAYSSYTTSSSASSTRAYYSAKVGTPYKYTRIMGKSGLSSDYPTTYTNSYYYPDGIFDLSKIYSYSSEGGFVDTYAKINTSEWAAPNWEDFYTLDATNKTAKYDNNSYVAFTGGAESGQITQKDNNTRVLAIYNKNYSGLGFRSNSKMTAEAGKYYTITTYVYLYKALELPNTATTGLSEAQVDANIDALNKFISEDVTAKIKLTGVTFAGSAFSNYGTQTRTLDTSKLFGENDVASFDRNFFYDAVTANETTTYNLKTDVALPYIDAQGKWVTALGEWQEITFKVAANTLSSRNIGIEFWLGEGSANDEYPVLQKGGAIFDGINILEGDSATDPVFDALSAESKNQSFITLSTIDIGENGSEYDIYGMTTAAENFTEFTSGESWNGYTFEYLEGINNTNGAATAGFIKYMENKEAWDAAGYDEKFGEYPGFTSVVGSDNQPYNYGMLVLKHNAFTASTLTLNDTTEAGYGKLAKIYANKFYRLGVMVRTDGVKSGDTLTLALILRNTASDKNAINSISSFTTVNTDGKWTEYVFYISGAVLANVRDENGSSLDANRVGLQLSFGSGDAYSSSTHTKGTVYLTGINFTDVSNSEYSDATSGDTVKKYSFSTSAYTSDTSTNGLFTNISYSDTMSNAEQVELGTVDKAAGSFEIKGMGTFWFNNGSTVNSEIFTDSGLNTPAAGFGKIVYTTDTTGYIQYKIGGATEPNFEFMINANRITASAYDDRGNLIILGTHSDGWSNNSFVYDKLNTPSVENRTVYVQQDGNDTEEIAAYTVRWKKVTDASKYEIYYNQTGNADDKLKIYSGAPAAEGGTTGEGNVLYENGDYVYFKLPSAVAGTYYVRAIPSDLKVKKISEYGSVTVSKKDTEDETKLPKQQGWSDRDWAAEITGNLNDFVDVKEYNSYRGIIDYNDFNRVIAGMGDIDSEDAADYLDNLATNLYAANTSAGAAATDGTFSFGNFSTNLYDNVLMFYSDVATYGGVTMSSNQTLSADSYYYISVWVLTVGADTKAAVSLDISSKVYDNSNGFEGYKNINTDGKWVEYRFLAKVGVTSATIKLGLSLGRKYTEGSSTKYEYSSGLVFFDNVTVKTLTEDEYKAFMTDKEGNAIDEWKYENNAEKNIMHYNEVSADALDKVFYNNDFAYVALDYVTDSFDTAGTSLDSSDVALGYSPSDYTHGMATSGVNNTDARSYGVYKATELNDERNSKFWTGTDLNGKAWYNGTINNLDTAKSYLTGFGANALMMVNYVDNGQYYRSNTRTLNSNTYYLISFYAKALLAEGNYAEFRFVHGNDTEKYDTVYIKGSGEEENGFRLYEMYVYNAASSSISSSYFSFNLGTYDSTKGVKYFIDGMLVVDNVTMKTVTADEYNAAVERYDAIPEANRKDAGLAYYKFETAEDNNNNTDGDGDNKEENSGSISAQTWLIISSAVIGAMILVAVVVVMIRQFRKKYVRNKVVGENKFDAVKKTEIEIKQQKGEANKRENADRDEFRD